MFRVARYSAIGAEATGGIMASESSIVNDAMAVDSARPKYQVNWPANWEPDPQIP
jgi:hypothetical protein